MRAVKADAFLVFQRGRLSMMLVSVHLSVCLLCGFCSVRRLCARLVVPVVLELVSAMAHGRL